MVQSINWNIKMQIDIRLIKFIHSCINHNYLSVKCDLGKHDWYCDVAHLL